MWSFPVIMFPKLCAEQTHVRFAGDDEVIKAFLLDCLNKSLHERDRIRCSNRGTSGLDLLIRECIQERLRVLPVVVVHQNLAGQFL